MNGDKTTIYETPQIQVVSTPSNILNASAGSGDNELPIAPGNKPATKTIIVSP